MWKQYFTPDDLQDALELLQQHQSQARLIAGGTDLVLDLSYKKLSCVNTLIDITKIPALKKIAVESGVITIGSAVTLSEIIQSDILKSHAPVLLDAALEIAGPQVRNIATIGGNVVNASPAADMVPPLLILDSMVSVIQPNQASRQIPLHSFLRGNRVVDLNKGEIVTGFNFRAPHLASKTYFRKVQPRRSMAIAMLNIAILLYVKDDRIADARIAMGAVAPTAVRVKSVEGELRNLPIKMAANPQVYSEVSVDIAPISDFRASRQYRTLVAQNLLREGIIGLLGLNEL